MEIGSLRKDFIRNLRGSTGVQLLGMVLGFVVGVQLARGLGVAGYGIYGSAMAAASFGATVASGGLQLHVTREVAASRVKDDPKTAARLVRWSLRNLLVIALLAGLTVGAYVLWGQGTNPTLAFAATVLTLLMSVLWLTGGVVRGTGAVVLGQAMDATIRPAALSVLFLIVFLTRGTIDPGLALALSCLAIIFASAFGFPTVYRVWVMSRNGSDKAERNVWRRASATMGLTTIIRAGEAALPLVVVGAVSSMNEAGLYRVATAVTGFLSIPASMISVMIPAMVYSLYERNELVRLERIATVSGLTVVIPTVITAVIIWVFGEDLLGFAFGSAYRPAASTMNILAGAAVIWSLSGISVSLLHAAKGDAIVSRAFGLSLAVIGLGVLLAANDGRAEAFAWAVLAGTAARTAFLVFYTRRLVEIDPTITAALRLAIQYLRNGR